MTSMLDDIGIEGLGSLHVRTRGEFFDKTVGETCEMEWELNLSTSRLSDELTCQPSHAVRRAITGRLYNDLLLFN